MKRKAKRRSIDYRHYICITITVLSVAAGYFFPNALPRLVETLRDLLTSALYYIADLVSHHSNTIFPTVCKFQEWRFASEIWQPIKLIPASFSEFFTFWLEYCKLVVNFDNLKGYLIGLSDFVYYLYQFLLIAFPIFIFVVIKLHNIKTTTNTERGVKSKQMLRFEKFLFRVVYPVIDWFKEFIYFCAEYNEYVICWIILWGLHLNVFSIVIAFAAYYLYFVSSWDLFSIYNQLLKLQTDLTPMVRFIPGVIWLLIGIKIYNAICKYIGFQRLEYAQSANQNVIRKLGIVSIIKGKMRAGKTQLATSMSLVAEKNIYDEMDDVMLKYERQFPNFTWHVFRDELDRLISDRKIVDLDSCRKRIQYMGKWFEYISNRYTFEEYQYLISISGASIDRSFGYDYDHYATSYNDNLRITKLFRALEEYACAYFVFTVKTCLIFANYSIRDDSILGSMGNKPFRDNNSLYKDIYKRKMYSRYAHILDQDMLRLQTKMVENNEYGRVLHPGAYVCSEIDKERKNMLELKEIKMNVDEANQKNDGFNASLMMSGHANLVDYKTIFYFFGDLQREDNLGAGARQLGDTIDIIDKSDFMPVLPFFSSYWFTQGIFSFIKEQWTTFKKEYDINRCDQTLFVYLVDNIISKINNHYDKLEGQFSMQRLTIEIQNGNREDDVEVDKWCIIAAIDRAERYRTDCLKGVFVTDPPNEKHPDDFIMYKGIMPTPEELGMQHSYFYNGVHFMKGKGK